jgi:uncharacterized membrane protein YjjP (DUF1212 family)
MKSSPKSPDTELLDFMLRFAKLYLAGGGPTSRLEEGLARLGARFGRNTESYATPTGVFVTISDPAGATEPKTAIARVRESGTNLGLLVKMEKTLADLVDGKMSLGEASQHFDAPSFLASQYRDWQLMAAACGVGFTVSFSAYQRFGAAFVSSLIAGIVWMLSLRFLKRQFANPLFSDFIGAFLALALAALAHGLVAPLALEAYALGAIVLLVPGLALTTAISELADQNLVSGTAKFMQATLALLALGLAYLIFQQLSFSLALRSVLQPVVHKSQFGFVSTLSILANITCFGVIFRAPPKALVWSTITGTAGWASLEMLTDTRAASAGPFLASFVVGLVSLGFGRMFRLPSQVFSVPGIVGMLPGMLALSSFRYFASGDPNSGVAFSFQVAITAVSIVFGLMTARIPYVLGAQARRVREVKLSHFTQPFRRGK